MKRFRNYSLKNHNTFGFDVQTAEAVVAESQKDVSDTARAGLLVDSRTVLLGGGSNVLLRSDISVLTVINKIPGIEIIGEDSGSVTVKAGAGVVWHEFVMWAVNRELGGVENLSLIPGSTGAAPMQNIGAYGVELESVFVELEAVDRKTGEVHIFDNKSCRFGYRQSIFKNELRNRYMITSVTMELKKNPEVNTSYGAIESELEKMKVSKPGVQDVSRAVIGIRRSKLPDPKEIGNSGSFFKNPVVSREQFLSVRSRYPEVKAFEVPGGMKLAAGWMIDRAGWKGKRMNGHGVHSKQALVLVNYGSATGNDIFELSESIIKDIQQKFGITLEREVNVIPE